MKIDQILMSVSDGVVTFNLFVEVFVVLEPMKTATQKYLFIFSSLNKQKLNDEK